MVQANAQDSGAVTQAECRGNGLDLPKPKYAIGDVVYWPSTTRDVEDLPCPDCLGTKKWKVVTPAGTEMEAECQRCARGGFRDIPRPQRVVYRPSVRRLTIGSIRIDTAASETRECVEYMCRETGIGSGSIYRESNLFRTEAEAETAAQSEAMVRTAQEDEKPQALAVRKISHLTLLSALIDEAWHQKWDAWYSYNRLKEDVDGCIGEEATGSAEDRLDDLKRALDWERNYRELPAIGDALHKLRDAVQMTHELEEVFAILTRPSTAPGNDDRTVIPTVA